MWSKLIRGSFDPQFESKKWVMPPKSICKNRLCQLLGIVSPSLIQVNSGDKVANYEIQILKYLCYKRKLKKHQWKRLYKEVRQERKEKEIFDIWFKKIEEKLRNEYDR